MVDTSVGVLDSDGGGAHPRGVRGERRAWWAAPWPLAVLALARLATAVVLVAGPTTDSAEELRGWDVERFVEIAEAPGRPYVDHPVEYPPAALGLGELVAAPTLPASLDRVVALALVADVVVLVLVRVGYGRRAAVTWWVVTAPLVPLSYVRFDLWAVAFAVAALVAARRERWGLGAAALGVAFWVKSWPAVLVVGAVTGRRWDRAAALAVGPVLALAVWVAVWGPEGPQQVAGFRGAEGWHVESVAGSVARLLDPSPVALESGSYRFGAVPAWTSTLLRAVTALALASIALRAARAPDGERSEALAAQAAVAALLTTSLLLSPQFLVWATPWTAVLWARGDRGTAAPAVGAAWVTALVLATWPPPALGDPLPQAALLARDVLLVTGGVLAWRRLGGPGGQAIDGDPRHIGSDRTRSSSRWAVWRTPSTTAARR